MLQYVQIFNKTQRMLLYMQVFDKHNICKHNVCFNKCRSL